MRAYIFALLALSGAAAEAQVYRCPQVYPGKDKPAAVLTSAEITQDTDLIPAAGFMTDDEAAEEGYNENYVLNPEWQTRLTCLYGNKKRTKGRFHDGHEWYQHMTGGGREWPVKLAPKISRCTLQVREIKPRDPSKSTWTATANCE
jgi:hypothetical protein